MSEWKTYKIIEFADVIGGGTPNTSIPEYWNGNISWITPRDLTGYRKTYISSGERNITEDGLKNSSSKILPKGSVLITSRAPIGYVAIADDEVCTNQGFKSLILNDQIANNLFIYYWVKNNNDFLNQMGTGTTFAEISGSVVKEIEINLPPLPEQKAIASVLSSLDDKIDLLHRQNETLEKMAETLFRKWFVEDAIEHDVSQYNLGEFIESVSNTHKFEDDKIVFLNTSDIYKGEILNDNLSDIYSLPGQAKKSIEKGDILFSEIRPANGRWAYIDFDVKNYVVSTKLMVLRSKGILSQAIIYFYLTNPSTVEWLQMLAESRSGTFPQITFSQLNSLKINVPNNQNLKDVSNWCEISLKKILSNKKQIKLISKLRDTLLPKLMSGEVRVKID
jgi:type I restriction enzyme S subunit